MNTFPYRRSGRTTITTLGVNPGWKECGSEADPSSRLLAEPGITICGVSMHVQAYAVKYDEKNVQAIADPEFEDDWRAICALYDYCFETLAYNGREYVIIAHPHGD